jgi:hypothetical protein
MELEADDWLNVEERSYRPARIAEGQISRQLEDTGRSDVVPHPYLLVAGCCCNKEGHSPEQLGNGFWFLLYRTSESSMLLHKKKICPDLIVGKQMEQCLQDGSCCYMYNRVAGYLM